MVPPVTMPLALQMSMSLLEDAHCPLKPGYRVLFSEQGQSCWQGKTIWEKRSLLEGNLVITINIEDIVIWLFKL